jgi:hypothetical protein
MNIAFEHGARELVRDTARLYLSPEFNTTELPDVAAMTADRGIVADPTDISKLRRYSLVSAGIHLLMYEAVEGSGVAACFRDDSREDYGRYPRARFEGFLERNMRNAGKRLRADENSRYSYFVGQYEALSIGASEAEEPNAAFIDKGGSLASEGVGFVGLTTSLISADRKAKRLEVPVRIAIAHQLIPVVTGRASKHVSRFPLLPNWGMALDDAVLRQQRNGRYALRSKGGGQLFTLSRRLTLRILREGPLIKCPAHQLLFGDETALEDGMHAVVNLAGDAGFYEQSRAGLLALKTTTPVER